MISLQAHGTQGVTRATSGAVAYGCERRLRPPEIPPFTRAWRVGHPTL